MCCLVCIEYEKGKLSFLDAIRNLGEVNIGDEEHMAEAWLKLVEDQENKNES